MEVLENYLNCQGLCKPTYFYFFRPISEGQPPRSCTVALKAFYDETFGILAWGLLTTIIAGTCTLMCSCGLFRKKRQSRESDSVDVSETSNDEQAEMQTGFDKINLRAVSPMNFSEHKQF